VGSKVRPNFFAIKFPVSITKSEAIPFQDFVVRVFLESSGVNAIKDVPRAFIVSTARPRARSSRQQ
jgi:hypothetical protein